MDISVIIPLLNESDSLSELHSSLKKVMISNSFTYEVIFIDDGSSDDSWDVINRISKENQSIKGIRFLKNYGKSQALHVGFLKAKGNVVFTMDADLQDDTNAIEALFITYDKAGKKTGILYEWPVLEE